MRSLIILFAIFGLAICKPQDITFADSDKPAEEAPGPGSVPVDGAATAEAPKEGDDDIITRAASTFQNCDCQCDSYTWTSKGKILGNCLSPDATGGNFCYVSGSAVQACRDIQVSTTRTDSFSDRAKYYSYEACATPPRYQCLQSGSPLPNFGDGDLVPAGGAYPSGGRPPISSGPGPFTGTISQTGPVGNYNGQPNLGAILGIRANTGDEQTTNAPETFEDESDSSAIKFADA